MTKKNGFEENLHDLEKIVNKMQESKLTLTEMFENYETANKLINKLESELEAIKQKFYIVNDEGKAIEQNND